MKNQPLSIAARNLRSVYPLLPINIGVVSGGVVDKIKVLNMDIKGKGI
jgi:hypothetical protein